MKKIRKILLCLIVFAELMVVLQPVSALVKGNVSEQYNMLGNAKRTLVKEVKPNKLPETVTETSI